MIIHGYEQGNSNGEIEAIPFNNLGQGTNLFRNFIACEGEDPVKLMAKLDGEKLKFSLGFRDIKTGEVVGFRKNDKVNLIDRNYNYLDLHLTRDSLQVLDNSGYVLQLKYAYPNKLFLNGYFVGNKGVVVY